MSQSIHRHTPTLAAVDSRRLPVSTIAYQHALADDIPLARVNRQAYDAAGRVIAQWDPRLWLLAQTEISVPANQTAAYSLSGQVLSSTSVDAGWRVNLPTESGQSLLGWDSRGSARLEYDALLRPVAMFEQAQGESESESESERCIERLRYADASPEAAARNLCGQLIRHDDPAGTLQLHEAGLGGGILQQSRRFLLQETPPDWPVAEPQRDALLETGAGAVTCQQYSALGESLQQTDAKGHRQRFAYDVAGQLHGTWLLLAGQNEPDEQVLLSAIVYNAFGQVEMETAGNGVVSTAYYSPVDGRLQQLLARKDDGTCLQDLTYTYDAVGNILSIRDDAQPVRHFNNQRIDPVNTYQYDTQYQLIKATGRESAAPARGPTLPGHQTTPLDPNQLANYTQNYSYDAGGNLTTLCHVGAQCYTYEMQVAAHSNRSVKKDEGDPATAFDANGNLRQLQPGQDLSWDLRNQLRQVTPVERDEAANDDEVYVYDGGGQRVRKIRHTQARSVMHRAEVRYLPGLELRTNTGTGEKLQVISVSAGRSGVRVLHWESEPPHDLPNDQKRYSLSDHLGSSSLELDQQAGLISQEGYYPYGGTAWWAGRHAIEAKYKTIRYSGKELDATGLYYYGFRYYAQWLNRWINPDPAGDIDGLNLYRMVRNNPVTFKDNDGRMPVPPPLPRLGGPPPPPGPGAKAVAPITRVFEPVELNKPQMPTNEASQAWKTEDYVDISELANVISELFGVPNQPINIKDVSQKELFEQRRSIPGMEALVFHEETLNANAVGWTSPQGVIYMGINSPDYSENGKLDADKIRSTIVHESLHFYSHQHIGFQRVTDYSVENSNYDEYVTDFFAEKVFKYMYPDATYKTGYFTKDNFGDLKLWGGNMVKFMIDSGHITESQLCDDYFKTGKLNPLPDPLLMKWKTIAKQKAGPYKM